MFYKMGNNGWVAGVVMESLDRGIIQTSAQLKPHHPKMLLENYAGFAARAHKKKPQVLISCCLLRLSVTLISDESSAFPQDLNCLYTEFYII